MINGERSLMEPVEETRGSRKLDGEPASGVWVGLETTPASISACPRGYPKITSPISRNFGLGYGLVSVSLRQEPR